MMKKLSNNFSYNELTRSDTARAHRIDNTPTMYEEQRLTQLCNDILQPIRDKWGKPIYITSGYRTPIVNRLVKRFTFISACQR